MGRKAGQYLGGSTVFGPGSSWFGRGDEPLSDPPAPRRRTDSDELREAFEAIDRRKGEPEKTRRKRGKRKMLADVHIDMPEEPRPQKEGKVARRARLLEEKYAEISKQFFPGLDGRYKG